MKEEIPIKRQNSCIEEKYSYEAIDNANNLQNELGGFEYIGSKFEELRPRMSESSNSAGGGFFLTNNEQTLFYTLQE